MCGIVAIVSPRVPVEPARITRALDRIAHRGPDGRGVYLAPSRRAALGHVRLAIVDLDHGAQPFVSTDGATAAVVNGEIYDSVRLLGDLRARGHDVRTRSDSEIALHAYRELGDDCTRLFRGELAMAIWDEAEAGSFARATASASSPSSTPSTRAPS
jgi:asparagine synthase (glutamine-hydrolysing)